MEKSIKVTISDDTGTVLDTYEVNLAMIERIERASSRSEQIYSDASEVQRRVTHEIKAALLRRAQQRKANAAGSAFAPPAKISPIQNTSTFSCPEGKKPRAR